MTNFLARLPLAALATCLASGAAMTAAVPAALAGELQAGEAGPMAYVFDGLDGPDLATAPGFAPVQAAAAPSAADSPPTMQPAPVRLALADPVSPPPFLSQPFLPSSLVAAPILAPAFLSPASPVQPVVTLLAASRPALVLPPLPPLDEQTATALAKPANQPASLLATAAALPQGPMPDGTSLVALSLPPAAEPAGADAPGLAAVTTDPAEPADAQRDAHGELLPLDAAQPPLLGPAPSGRMKPAVLSRLDGPGPLPPVRPLAQLVGPPLTSEAASAPTDPGDASPLADPDPAPEPAAATAKPGETESLTDAIIASLKGNPEIQIALAQQDDAKYGVMEARAGYLPKVDVTGAWGREFARTVPQTPTQRFRTEATVSLNQNLWDFGVTINDIKRARATYRARSGARARRSRPSPTISPMPILACCCSRSWSNWRKAKSLRSRRSCASSPCRRISGSPPRPMSNARRPGLKTCVRSCWIAPARWNRRAMTYKRLTDHMPLTAADVPAAGQALPESAEAAVDMIDTRSPRLAQAVEDRRSLDKQYDSQADTTLPRFGLSIASDYRRDVLGATGRAFDARAMVTFSYQLYNGGATTAIKHRIGARLRQADFELDRRRREVEQDIRIDYAALGAAKEKIATIEDEITSAQRVADLYKQQFRGGRRTVFDLLDSEQLLFGARAKQIANQLALRAAEYRVLQKLGGLFDLVSGGQPLPALAVPAPGSDD